MQTTAKGFKKPNTDGSDNADLRIFVGDNMDLLETELNKKVDTTKKASATELGLIKIGNGLSIDANGVVTASGGGGGSYTTTQAFNAYQTTAQGYTAGAWTRVTFEATQVSIGSGFDLTNDEYVVTEAGTYAIGGSISWGNNQADGNRTVMAWYKNGVSAGWIADISAGKAGQSITTGNTIVQLAVGDKISLWVYTTATVTSGTMSTQIVSGNSLTYFYGHKL